MITSIILAACLTPVTMDGDPLRPCPLDRVENECDCAECFIWDDVAFQSPYTGGERYEVKRRYVVTGDEGVVGVRRTQWAAPCYPPDCDEYVPGYWVMPLAHWCPQLDDEGELTPIEGELYQYTVRACNSYACSEWVPWLDGMKYRAAPTACYESGVEVRCYPGDPLNEELQ